MHIVCFYISLDVTSSVIADHNCFPSGVTTCVYGGTSGAKSFEEFKRVIDRSRVRILAFLYIAAPGANKAEQDPSQFDVQLVVETAKKYPGIIVGFKTAHYEGKFDLGHAGASFLLRIVVPAIKQGFIPDSISADLFGITPTTTGINLANVMSKFICLGVPLEDVIRRTTVNPSQIINRPELGNLSVGSTADIAVFEMVRGEFSYLGTGGDKINGDRKLQCVMTLFGGKIVYDHPYGLSYPYWEDIPKDSSYWVNPNKQKW